jgi:menaquinone-dependent protoporphyrinogen oxidase
VVVAGGSGGCIVTVVGGYHRPGGSRRKVASLATLSGMSPTSPRHGRILVAYASKYGSTRELAETLGEVLADEGLAVEVRPAIEVRSLASYGAVVLGSGLYAATWLRDANVFIRANRRALAMRPLWLFSSGPLDRSAELAEIPMTPHVHQVLGDLEIRGHRTFGGRLLADTPEVRAGLMAATRIGDFRDFERVRAWGREIAAALR